jgi:hypothetical protein
MIVVNRREIIAWRQGYALIRIGNKLVAPKDDLCIAAEDALERGEKVALTENGRIVSYLVPYETGIMEEPETKGAVSCL